MNNTDLFDFSFVNRDRERIQFINFMLNPNNSILWISGDRGIGKTKFVKYMMQNNSEYLFCYFDIKADWNNDEILQKFIQLLERKSQIHFCDFLEKEYKSLAVVTNSAIKVLAPNHVNISSFLLNAANFVLTYKEERREPIDIIWKYISKIIAEKKVFICIDNFSKCSKDAAEIFLDTLKYFGNNISCRNCIITTSQDTDHEKKRVIREFVPCTEIRIKQLDDTKYFYQILNPIFDMKTFTDEDITYLYNKCHGEPQKLSTVISKLLDKDGIIYNISAKKAKIRKDILKAVLSKEYINYCENDFTSVQKWILYSFLCLYDNVEIREVESLALFFAQKNYLYHSYGISQFGEELNKLIDSKKLLSDGSVISICHDSDYIDFMDIFVNSGMYALLSQNAYEFLHTSSTLQNREDLICKNMRNAQLPGWQIRNYEYGESFYKKGAFYDAQKYFIYLIDEKDCLDSCQKLTIAVNQYEVGRFDLAIQILSNIDICTLENPLDKHKCLFFYGKSIYNDSGNIMQAIEELKKSLQWISASNPEYVQTKNVLQMYYIETPDNENEASQIFEEIRDNYKDLYPNQWASTMRGCHNFIKNDLDALKLLFEAIENTDDELEKAYIKTTIGFVYARTGDFDEAKKQFEISYNAIKEMKRHEASYAANNLAVCYMINGKYLEAKNLLQDALFWNRTNYGKIVINVHLMLCNLFLHNNLEAENEMVFLQNYMDQIKSCDNCLNRKVYLNLAVAYKYLEQNIMFQKTLKKAEPYVLRSSSEWRFHVLQGNSEKSTPKNRYYGFTQFDPWFLVYAHD